jgi:chemotaxis protein CheD
MGQSSHIDAQADGDPLLVRVAVGQLTTACHPQRLMTPALGSCVGVALWDQERRVGAMAHVMLPCPGRCVSDPESGRFASSAVPALVGMLVESGSDPRSLCAKIAGGAVMFGVHSASTRIGERNVAEVKHQLEAAGIRLCAEDTGGSHARTIELHLDSGVLVVRSYRHGMRHI